MYKRQHYDLKGKIEVVSRAKVDSKDALSLAYTPGVAQPCLEIQKDVNKSYDLTRRWNTVAVVTDGTAAVSYTHLMNNTIFDDVFRTMIEKMPYLAVPLINEVFHTSYPENVPIVQLRNEHQQENGEIITDSCLKIAGKLYHICLLYTSRCV